MRSILVTGAAGFIGSNLVRRLATEGHQIVGVDNCSRRGSELNFAQLSIAGFDMIQADVADRTAMEEIFESFPQFDFVFHLAGQVAVTTSYRDPVLDFRSNAAGSFTLFELVSKHAPDAHIVYASTNKVFGDAVFSTPVSDSQSPRPYSPYGVSKYVGDLYLDEFRRAPFRLSSTSLRQSCIYGPGQMGVEDQGWVAWFMLANLREVPITIFGDGAQVRDLLFIDDLLDLYAKLIEHPVQDSFVVGGGPRNAWSVDAVVRAIPTLTGKDFSEVLYGETRPGDQPYFVSSNAGISGQLDWEPETDFHTGAEELLRWLRQHENELKKAGL